MVRPKLAAQCTDRSARSRSVRDERVTDQRAELSLASMRKEMRSWRRAGQARGLVGTRNWMFGRPGMSVRDRRCVASGRMDRLPIKTRTWADNSGDLANQDQLRETFRRAGVVEIASPVDPCPTDRGTLNFFPWVTLPRCT